MNDVIPIAVYRRLASLDLGLITRLALAVGFQYAVLASGDQTSVGK